MKYALIAATSILSVLLLACSSPEKQCLRIEAQIRQMTDVFSTDEGRLSVAAPDLLDSLQQRCSALREDMGRITTKSPETETPACFDRTVAALGLLEKHLYALRSDPALYNIGEHLKRSLADRVRPLNERLNIIKTQMELSGDYYNAAKRNLQKPDPDRTGDALQNQMLTLDFLDTELTAALQAAALSSHEKEAFQKVLTKARMEVKDYLAFCRSLQFEHRDSLPR